MKIITSILIAVVLITNGTMMWRQHNIIEAQAELIEEKHQFILNCGTIISLMIGPLLTAETIEEIKKMVDSLNEDVL